MSQSLFFRLPLEIRRQIYGELLIGTPPKTTDVRLNAGGGSITERHYHEYYKTLPTKTHNPKHVLRLRNSSCALDKTLERTTYMIRSDRFRARCVETTYICENVPAEIDVAILSVNRQIHNEAAHLFYSHYTFDFDTHIEACVPFLMDLSPFSRSCVSRISVVKRALPYDKDFDRCEWASMCDCISSHLELARLDLGIVGGLPKPDGWNTVRPIGKEQYDGIVQYNPDGIMMQWVDDLVKIRKIDGLRVRACVEHCPPPTSSAMAFFVAFSASIESGFSEYLMEKMKMPALCA